MAVEKEKLLAWKYDYVALVFVVIAISTFVQKLYVSVYISALTCSLRSSIRKSRAQENHIRQISWITKTNNIFKYFLKII